MLPQFLLWLGRWKPYCVWRLFSHVSAWLSSHCQVLSAGHPQPLWMGLTSLCCTANLQKNVRGFVGTWAPLAKCNRHDHATDNSCTGHPWNSPGHSGLAVRRHIMPQVWQGWEPLFQCGVGTDSNRGRETTRRRVKRRAPHKLQRVSKSDPW